MDSHRWEGCSENNCVDGDGYRSTMAFYSCNTFCSAPDSQFPGLEIITAIDVAGLKILIKAGAVDHIFEKHGQGFEYAARGAFNLEAREYQVANYI